MTDEELDNYWRNSLQDTEAPDIIVCLNARMQELRKELREVQGELRDWARMEIANRSTGA